MNDPRILAWWFLLVFTLFGLHLFSEYLNKKKLAKFCFLSLAFVCIGLPILVTIFWAVTTVTCVRPA